MPDRQSSLFVPAASPAMHSSSFVRKRKRFPWHIVVFLAPAALVYSLFMVYPLIDSLRLSFFSASGGDGEIFVGLQNYGRLLTDDLWAPRFWGALVNNFIFFAVHMLVQNPIGLLLAALLTQRDAARSRISTHRLLYADHVVVCDRRLYLAIDLEPALGHRRGSVGLCRPGEPLPALAGAGEAGTDHALSDLGLAIYRYPDDALLRRADQHSRGTGSKPHTSTAPAGGPSSGASNFH